MAYSAGFSPHPKISYLGAAPTGVASEAEYLEIGLAARVDIEAVRAAIDSALPDGLDLVDAVEAGPGALADRMEASVWRVDLAGADPGELERAVEQVLGQSEVLVVRLTKDGRRELDARAAIVAMRVASGSGDPNAPQDGPSGVPDASSGAVHPPRAILHVVVRQATPAVRPDDVLAALATVAGFVPPHPPLAVRLAQGPLDDSGQVGDPLAADHAASHTSPPQ